MKPVEKFVLRWFSGVGKDQVKRDYFPSSAAPFVETQREAFRFDSREEALAAVESFSHFGADGPHDTSGWKAVRLVPKKSSS